MALPVPTRRIPSANGSSVPKWPILSFLLPLPLPRHSNKRGRIRRIQSKEVMPAGLLIGIIKGKSLNARGSLLRFKDSIDFGVTFLKAASFCLVKMTSRP
jgi:hypothetical protein